MYTYTYIYMYTVNMYIYMYIQFIVCSRGRLLYGYGCFVLSSGILMGSRWRSPTVRT